MQIEAFVGETVANMLPGMFKLVGKCGKVCCGVSVLKNLVGENRKIVLPSISISFYLSYLIIQKDFRTNGFKKWNC